MLGLGWDRTHTSYDDVCVIDMTLIDQGCNRLYFWRYLTGGTECLATR